MMRIPDWRGIEIKVGRSAGGVVAVANAWENVIRTGVAPWPAPELLQKLYESRQKRAYRDNELSIVLDTHDEPLGVPGGPTSRPGLYFIGFLHTLRGHLFEANRTSRRLARHIESYLTSISPAVR